MISCEWLLFVARRELARKALPLECCKRHCHRWPHIPPHVYLKALYCPGLDSCFEWMRMRMRMRTRTRMRTRMRMWMPHFADSHAEFVGSFCHICDSFYHCPDSSYGCLDTCTPYVANAILPGPVFVLFAPAAARLVPLFCLLLTQLSVHYLSLCRHLLFCFYPFRVEGNAK